MSSDEAPSLSEPRKCNRKWALFYRTLIYFLFVVAIALALFSFNLYGWYNETKKDYQDAFLRAKYVDDKNIFLINENEIIKSDYQILKEDYSKILKQNEEILEQIEELRNRTMELENINKELVEDNIELQNSLKQAASIGIKPLNYTSFEGISSRDSIERGEYLGKFLGTFYTPSAIECGNNGGITRSGKPIIPGISIAIDKEHWPFGTIFYIKGLGYAVAMDTGSAIKGKYRFDFAVFDRNFAKKLGKDYWDVYLVKLGDGKVDNISL